MIPLNVLAIGTLAAVDTVRKVLRNRKGGKLFETERAARDNARCFCEDCSIELSQQAAFCHKCGSSRVITRGAMRAEEQRKRREKQEKTWQDRVAKEQAKHQRSRTKAARKLCREIVSHRYCGVCRVERESIHKFCIVCGGAMKPIGSAAAFERAHNKFPDIIRTEDDFNRFVK